MYQTCKNRDEQKQNRSKDNNPGGWVLRARILGKINHHTQQIVEKMFISLHVFSPQSGIQKLEKVEITLADCLACSGCITSAEGVLISQQSQEELLRVMNANNLAKLNNQRDEIKFVVFTVSQQPILSLARKYNLTPEDTFEHIAGKIRFTVVD